jgi:Flp pilus assembly pilin Flp
LAEGFAMINHLLSANRRRVPVKYAMIAAGLAVASVVALEAAGTALSTSYSGLGGKLAPVTAGAADIAPARATDPRSFR